MTKQAQLALAASIIKNSGLTIDHLDVNEYLVRASFCTGKHVSYDLTVDTHTWSDERLEAKVSMWTRIMPVEEMLTHCQLGVVVATLAQALNATLTAVAS